MKLFILYYLLLQISSVINLQNPTNQQNNNNVIITKDNLNLFKKQINKIGVNTENFIIDLFSQLLNTTIDDETETTSFTEQTTPEIVSQVEENDDNFYTTTEKLQRIKRSTQNQQILQNIPSKCIQNEHEHKLERYHIEDIKQEVNNLRELVLLLRDQQEIIKLLQNETKNSEHLLPKTNTGEIKKQIINELSEKPTEYRTTHEELQQLKYKLKNLVVSLNETQQLLAIERRKETRLEDELNLQRKELFNLKRTINKLFENKTQHSHDDEIVGSTKFIHPPPIFKPTTIENKSTTPTKTQSRASESSDITRLLDLIAKTDNKQDSTTDADILNKIKTLQEQLEKREKDEDILKQLVVIQRLIKQNNNNKDVIESKTIDDSVLLTKLLNSLANTKQTKTDDENLIIELRNLQNAINRLRPKEDGFNEFNSKSEQEQFQIMLNKLISEQNRPKRPNFNQQMLDKSNVFIPNGFPYLYYQTSPYSPHYQPIPYFGPPNYPPPQYYDNPPQDNSKYIQTPQQYDNINKNQFFPAPTTNPYNSYNSVGQNSNKLPQYSQPIDQNYGKQSIESLKSQIYELQNVIKSLNQPGYIQNPDDKRTIYDLEQQIGDLRNIVNSMTTSDGGQSYQPPVPPPSNPNYEQKSRRKRSIDDNRIDNDVETFTNMLQRYFPMNDSEVVPKTQPRTSQNQVYAQIGEEIQKIRNQLESHPMETNRASYLPNYQIYSHSTNKFELEPPKEPSDHLTKIVLKIVDKILGLTPIVLRRISNYLLNQLGLGGYNYENASIFQIVPIILMRILDGLSTFINVLRYNKFLRTFLIPVLVLILVGGGVIFLIWFLQPADYYDYTNTYNKELNSDYNNQYASNSYNNRDSNRENREMIRKFDNSVPQQYYRTYFDRS